MPDFKLTQDIISMSEFRTTLADCVARTSETHRPIILTQNGRATSVFLSAADWEKIAEKIERLDLYEDILIGEGELQRGETISHEQAMRDAKALIAKHSSPTSRKRRTQKIEAA